MSGVNTETGEITEPGTALAPIDRTAVSVVTTLENAKRWLSTAVEMTGPEEIAAAKAHIRTAETYARELHLSKDIQLDAQEMVRRAEYALGKSIRKGQAEGTIAKHGGEGRRGSSSGAPSLKSPRDFASKFELSGSGGDPGKTAGIYNLTDGIEDGQFDEAIDEARAEGNLSRANVARKAREKSGKTPQPADAGTTERNHQEAELINAFAAIVKRSLTPKNVSTLSPRAKKRLLAILEDAIQTLKGTEQ